MSFNYSPSLIADPALRLGGRLPEVSSNLSVSVVQVPFMWKNTNFFFLLQSVLIQKPFYIVFLLGLGIFEHVDNLPEHFSLMK